MKHLSTVTRQPQVASTTLLQEKLDFLTTAVPAVIQIWLNKHQGGALP